MFGEDEMQAVRIEEGLDVLPHDREVGLAHVGPVFVHALEPLHRDAIEAGVVVSAVVTQRAGLLLITTPVETTLAGRNERAVHGPPMLVELRGREARLAAQQTRQSDHVASSDLGAAQVAAGAAKAWCLRAQ